MFYLKIHWKYHLLNLQNSGKKLEFLVADKQVPVHDAQKLELTLDRLPLLNIEFPGNIYTTGACFSELIISIKPTN